MPKKAFLALLVLLLLMLGYDPVCCGSETQFTVSYFYFNACSACNEEEEFLDDFLRKYDTALIGTDVSFVCYNTFAHSEETKYREACEALDIPENQRTLPMLVIGRTALLGAAQIDSGVAAALAAETSILTGSTIADPFTSKPVYFYVMPCEDCAAVKEYLDSMQPSYQVYYQGMSVASPLSVESYNVAEAQGLELARKYYKAWKVPENRQKVPVIFLRDGYLGGMKEIKDGLENAILEGRCIGTGLSNVESGLKPYELSGVFLTGLINGFNPCSVSLLLLLMTLLLSRNTKIMKLGLTFIAGKSLAYLALGTVLFGVLLSIDSRAFLFFQKTGKILLLILALAVAAVNVSDFVAAKNERYNKIYMQLPAPLRRFNHKWIQKITQKTNNKLLLLAVFALGMIISVGEFLCTGQIYLATILYMIKRNPSLNFQAIGTLMIYIAGMMIPLLVLTIAVWKGREVFNLTELTRRNMPVVKLINAAIFLVFGILIFLNY